MVTLENDRLRAVLDPERAGGAVSLVDAVSGKDLAGCESYRQRRIPALIEILAGQAMAEGRVDESPSPCALISHGRDADGAESAVFRARAGIDGFLKSMPGRRAGFPMPAVNWGPDPAGPGRVPDRTPHLRLEKTVRLCPDQARLRVTLDLANASGQNLDLAGWISSGVRIPDEDCLIYAPTPGGTLARAARWHRDGSFSINVPAATAGWTGAVAADPARTGLYLAAPDRQVEAVWNWLGKFSGFTLGMGWPRLAVAPGQVLRIAYTLGITHGLPRLDGATAGLAGGVARDPDSGRLHVHLMAQRDWRGRVTVARRGLHAGGPAERLWSRPVRLAGGRAERIDIEAPVGDADTYVFTVSARASGGGPDAEPLGMVHVETHGPPRQRYQRSVRRLVGARYWGARVGDRPLEPRTQRCDRKVRHPMIPWLTPTARPARLKVLFVGEVSFNTAVFRDLARRGDFDWRFVNVWGTGDLLDGPYGRAEILRARRLLKRFRPDVVLTAGLRYDDVETAWIDALWAFARGGGGVVIVGRDHPQALGPWPGRLEAEAEREAGDPAARLVDVFDAGVAPGPMGTTHSYRLGAGRVVLLRKQLDWPTLAMHGDAGPRNDLLPRYRGRTELPDWEYHFAQYLLTIRWAAGAVPGVSVALTGLSRERLALEVVADAARSVAIAYECLSVDQLTGRRGGINRDLAAGATAVHVPIGPLPANTYVVHVWILDGPVATSPDADLPGARALCREGHERPVIDFTAGCLAVQGPVAIEALTIDGGRQPVPEALAVTVAGDSALLARAEIEVEWRHGAQGRVVWRRREPLQGRRAPRWDALAFEPVSPQSWAAARIVVDGAVWAERGVAVTAWAPGVLDARELTFLTAAGGEHDWYGTRMMRDWAEREAGFDFTYLRYALPDHGFPWRRTAERKLDPPIVHEEVLHASLAHQLREVFETHGNACVNLSDEFLLRGEYDWSAPTLAAFRAELARRHGDVAALNAQWGTAFADFAEVSPVTLDVARRTPQNPSRWIAFRLFMDARVNRRFEIALEEAARISPLLKVGDSGAYAPGVAVGINHYRMMRASTFTMSYAGLRADWARSFARDDALLGVWTGYGRDDPAMPWTALFAHLHVLAWWGYLLHKRLTARTGMSLVHLDLTPSGRFREVGRQQREIRDGLGALLKHAVPARPRVRLPYSQASVYTLELLGESHEDGANAAAGLLRDARLAYVFMADEQVRDGALAATRDALFVWANVDAWDGAVAEAYVRAVMQGCHALADVCAGMRDGLGRRLAAGPLDAVLGIDRSQARLEPPARFEPIGWTSEAPAALRAHAGQMVRALTGLRVAGNRVWARFADGEPAIVAAPTAGGSLVVTLNTRLPWVSANRVAPALNPEDRPDELSPNATIGYVLAHLLARAGIRPYAEVRSTTLAPRTICRFDHGDARYFGLLFDDAEGAGEVILPAVAPTYDVRGGRYLGRVDRVSASLRLGERAKVYAQLPYGVSALRATAGWSETAGGRSLVIEGALMADEALPAGAFHVIHAEIRSPDGGDAAPWHRRNLPAPGGRFAWRVPLALNAPSGRWRIALRDVATGRRRVLNLVHP